MTPGSLRRQAGIINLAALVICIAPLSGCSTHPLTGRDQMVGLPAATAHADVGFALSKSAKRMAEIEAIGACDEACQIQQRNFSDQATRIGKSLEAAARDMSPDTFERIDALSIEVDPDLGVATASSAGGRIALGGGLARLEPNDDVTAFLIAREMAHVIARHDEEDSGARIFFSAITAVLPVAMLVRLVASALGSGAMMGSWAGEQRREADEIALALLARTGRTVQGVSSSLAKGLRMERMADDEWAVRYKESAVRVAAAAEAVPKYASFESWLARESELSIERILSCLRQAQGRQAQGQTAAESAEKRRDCSGRAG